MPKFKCMSPKLPLRTAAVAALFAMFFNQAYGQSPTAPAKGFNTFVENNLTLITNENEGPIACGGNLTLKNNYQVAVHNAGTFMVNNVKIGLLVGGKVNYEGGNALQINSNGYVKIGTSAGSTVWYYDQNNAASPIRITPGSDYNGSPRIMLQANANQLGVNSGNNPVFQSGVLDFADAFSKMRTASASIAQCTHNAQITNPNGQSIANTNLPNQIKINMQNGINYFNITGADLNNVQNFTFNSQPSASKILIINVNAAGTFNWNVWSQAGVSFQHCPYILYNFYNTTQLNINGNPAVEGTIFAPFADINKTANQSNIEGQVIGKSFVHGGGEVHYAVFSPTVTGCAPVAGVAPTANFMVNNDHQCFSGHSFEFTNYTTTGDAVQPEAPLSYSWNFGDGTTSTAMNPTKTYSAPGAYTVTLTATNTYGTHTITKNVVVFTEVPANVTVTTAGNAAGSVTKQIKLVNTDDYNYFSWTLPGLGAGQYINTATINHTFSAAGYYEVIVNVIGYGCQYNTIVPVVISSEEVNTGNEGGLESESLGDALSKRYVQRKLKSAPTVLAKSDANTFDKARMTANFASRNASGLTLLEMFPTQLVAGNTAHVTSPTDILDYTVAQEVLAVDFEVNGKTKGVVLGIRTRDKVYNHTKASCDRLRGAEILNVKAVEIDGYKFLQQAIKQRNGVTEYAISFAAAKNNNDDNYILQTNWLVKEYTVLNDMYNFQVWATAPEYTQKMVKDVLANLKGFIPVTQTEIQKLPKTYAAKVWRDGTDMVLKLKSAKEDQSIEITMDEVYSETNGFALRYNPFQSETEQEVRLDIKDGYEYDGIISVEGEKQDIYYHADGNWGLDFDPTYTTINSYVVSNDFDRQYSADELAVNRNVKLQAHSEFDYLTLYKSLLPGQIPADYSEYGYLSFKAKGSGLMELGLIKSSIQEWKDQYRAFINVRNSEQTYYVPFSFFKSAASIGKITADDLSMISFTFLPVEAGTNDLDLTIENVKFTKNAPEGYEELLNTMRNEFLVYPNPSFGNVNCLLYSDVATTATVTLHDITGKLIYSKPVNLEEGRNELEFNFGSMNSGMMFFNVTSPTANYGTSKVVFK